jgi:hypothetical protein
MVNRRRQVISEMVETKGSTDVEVAPCLHMASRPEVVLEV